MSSLSVKRRRVTQACDFCHRRGRKCRAPTVDATSSPDSPTLSSNCLTCIEYGVQCTRQRVTAKRGVKTKKTSEDPQRLPAWGSSNAAYQARSLEAIENLPLRLMATLVEVYFDTVYPMCVNTTKSSYLIGSADLLVQAFLSLTNRPFFEIWKPAGIFATRSSLQQQWQSVL